MTGAGSPRDSLSQFFTLWGRIRPVDRCVGLVRERDGAYRVLYSITLGDARPEHFSGVERRDQGALPLRRGGLLERLTGGTAPLLLHDVVVEDDPALPRGTYSSVLALPVFNGPDVVAWTIALGRSCAPAGPGDVVQALMTANLLGMATRQMEALAEIGRLNQRLSDQYDQIARLQQGLLPARLPAIAELEIATSYLTSEQAGGDYYDFFDLSDGRLGALIADVSGHGAAAATLMAMLRAILHSSRAAHTPSDVGAAGALHFVNQRLVESSLEGAFVTAFLMLVDPASGAVDYACAGHPPPRLRRAGSGAILALDAGATRPLGILGDLPITGASVRLQRGDAVLLYTDGVSELFDGGREMFGTTRLDECLARGEGVPDAVVALVTDAMVRHRGSSTRDDDQTLVVLRYAGPP